MTAFLDQLRQQWLEYALPPQRVLIGVSGGADSVALLRGLHQLQGELGCELEVAHFHHGLRGEAADEDQQWVQQLCRQLDVPCHCGRLPQTDVETPAEPGTTFSENHLRQWRHDFLLQTAQQRACGVVCLGHHAQDQVETLLHHLLRGTSLRGLQGIPARRPFGLGVELLHPLLGIFPETLRAYLQSLPQEFRTDASNLESGYTRNRLRLELLPILESIAPQGPQQLLKLRDQIEETLQFHQELVAELREQTLLQQSADILRLQAPVLRATHPVLVRELFVTLWEEQHWPRGGMGRADWQRLQQILQEQQARLQLPGRIDVQLQGDLLRLERTESHR